ncbi:aldose 1-epimerase [Synergistales bacterium]|nr:aldose 1-epimerase [Synergistales bacterium]
MSVTVKEWGTADSGKGVFLYELSDDKGIIVRLTNYGGTIVGIDASDKNGVYADVVLGYDNIDGYVNGTVYHGGTIGRFANRIADGTFILNGQTYNLPKNDGGNCLHGGSGFNYKVWETVETGENSVTFAYTSDDGEDGFPGKLDVKVQYVLTDSCNVSIISTLRAYSDTVAGLTNHSYFNLSGNGGDITETFLKLYADSYTPLDDTGIPTGEIASVSGTRFDFREERKIGQEYDDNFVLGDDVSENLRLATEAYDADSGRTLKVLTTMPALQFYTGNYLDETGKNGACYGKHSGFALEAQFTPDTPNLINKTDTFPSCVIKSGETKRYETVFQFGVKQ